MKIKIWIKDTALPRDYENVVNTYEEGSFFCIQFLKRIIKFPVVTIFKIDCEEK